MRAAPQVSLGSIFARFVTIGAVSFGGGIVAYLQRMLVEQTRWLDADEFMVTLEISQTMPGLNAVNMSVLVGDRLRGPIGALIATLGIVLPGALFVFGVGYGAAAVHHTTPVADAALKGVAAGAVGLLAAIVVRTGKKQFTNLRDLILVAVTFFAMSILKLPLYVVLLVLAPIAIYLYRPRKLASEPEHV